MPTFPSACTANNLKCPTHHYPSDFPARICHKRELHLGAPSCMQTYTIFFFLASEDTLVLKLGRFSDKPLKESGHQCLQLTALILEVIYHCDTAHGSEAIAYTVATQAAGCTQGSSTCLSLLVPTDDIQDYCGGVNKFWKP